MNNSNNSKVGMEQRTSTSYLKCDNPSVSAAEDHARESIVVVFECEIQVPPTIANTVTTTPKHQAALTGEKNWRSDDGAATNATAWDNSVPPEYTMIGIGRRTDIREEAREEQTPPPVYAVVERPQIDDASQTQDNRANSSHKPKKRKLTHIDDTPRPSSRSPSPSPPLTDSRARNKKRAKVNWTKQEENLLKQGREEGLEWQAIANKYLPKRGRSGCYLHWQGMQAKMLHLSRDWTQDENKRLTQVMKALSKEFKEMWSKAAEKLGNGRTGKEIEMQRARLLMEGEKKRKRT